MVAELQRGVALEMGRFRIAIDSMVRFAVRFLPRDASNVESVQTGRSYRAYVILGDGKTTRPMDLERVARLQALRRQRSQPTIE